MGTVRHDLGVHPTPQPPQLAIGELVWGSIRNGIENPFAIGKDRPLVLVEPQGFAWRVAGLTTNPRYASGVPRTPVPHPSQVGLRRPGWVWSPRLCVVSGIDLGGGHIGWVDEDLVLTLAELCGLAGDVVGKLLHAAHLHHRAGVGSLGRDL